MFVSDLITAISKFAFGRKNPTESDRKDYLFLLNLADCEYYACAKNSNLLREKKDIFFNNLDNFASVPDNYIYGVYNNKTKLKELDENNHLSFDKNNEGYYFLAGNIYVNKINLPFKTDIDGISKQYITLLVQPKRKQLVEVIVNNELEINIPMYPEEYHLGLVHGATYYLCQTHEAFVTKMAESKENWKLFKQNLTSHYVKGV